MRLAAVHLPTMRDLMPLRAKLSASWQHGFIGKLGTVVADDHAGLPRFAINSVNSRTTRRREVDVRGTAAK